MKKFLPLLLIPSAAFGHPGHDVRPTPEGLSHAMGHTGHLSVILGAAGAALIVVAAIAFLRRKRRGKA